MPKQRPLISCQRFRRNRETQPLRPQPPELAPNPEHPPRNPRARCREEQKQKQESGDWFLDMQTNVWSVGGVDCGLIPPYRLPSFKSYHNINIECTWRATGTPDALCGPSTYPCFFLPPFPSLPLSLPEFCPALRISASTGRPSKGLAIMCSLSLGLSARNCGRFKQSYTANTASP